MKRKLTYVGQCVCDDCGTGYGETGPISRYQCEGDDVLLCDECAEESDDKSDLEEEEEDEDDTE